MASLTRSSQKRRKQSDSHSSDNSSNSDVLQQNDQVVGKKKKRKNIGQGDAESDTKSQQQTTEAPMASQQAPMAPQRIPSSKEDTSSARRISNASTDSKFAEAEAQEQERAQQAQLHAIKIDINIRHNTVNTVQKEHQMYKKSRYVQSRDLAESLAAKNRADPRINQFYEKQCNLIPHNTLSTMEAENAAYKFRDFAIREYDAISKYNDVIEKTWPKNVQKGRPQDLPLPLPTVEFSHWVEIGDLYVTPIETGVGAWRNLVEAKMDIDGTKDFVIYTGMHGSSGGQHIDKNGEILPKYQDPTHTRQDDEKVRELRQLYGDKGFKIERYDVFDKNNNLKNPEALRRDVQAKIAEGKTVIMAWCFSLEAFTSRTDPPPKGNTEAEQKIVAQRDQTEIGNTVHVQYGPVDDYKIPSTNDSKDDS